MPRPGCISLICWALFLGGEIFASPSAFAVARALEAGGRKLAAYRPLMLQLKFFIEFL